MTVSIGSSLAWHSHLPPCRQTWGPVGICCCLFVAVCACLKLSPGVCLPAGESPTYASVLNIGNMVFTGFFCIEMVMKLFALNFFEYLCDAFNIFDAVVVIISVVEIALEVG